MISIFPILVPPKEPAASAQHGGWIDVVAPNAEEIERLEREWGIPPEFVMHSVDIHERSRVEERETATLVILRISSAQNKEAAIPFITIPLGFILRGPWIVTVCQQKTDILDEVRRLSERDQPTSHPERIMLEVFKVMAERYLAHLNLVNSMVDRLEERLGRSLQNREVLALLKYQKCLVYFTTALRANEMMLERLRKSEVFSIGPEDRGLLEDALVEIRQAIDVSSISNDILTSLMGAFASIISNNVNAVMKLLAALGVIISFPILLTSFYGMNVFLPGTDSPYAFWGLLLASGLGSSLIAFFFRRRDWL